jgi:hypothetical protein
LTTLDQQARQRAASRRHYAKNRAKEIARVRAWNDAHPEKKARHKRTWWLRLNYGMTQPQFLELLAKQDGACAICGTLDPAPHPSFSVDHDHQTGKVRGLLCFNCNIALGKFRDSPDLLEKALVYLHGRTY